MNQEFQKIDISTATFVRIILLTLGIVFLYLVRDVVAIILFSVVVASAVDPAAAWFQKHKIPRLLGVIIIYIIAFVVFIGAFSLIIPNLFSELSSFSSQLPDLVKDGFKQSGVLFEVLPELPEYVSGPLSSLVSGLIAQLSQFTDRGFFYASTAIFGGASSFVLIIVLSFYLAVQEDGIEKLIRIITPKKHELYMLDLWSRSRMKLGRWLQTQILLGLLVGVMVYLGLTILRIKFALSLALLAAIFELIPLFGPVLAAIPSVMVAFLQSPTLALIVVGFYIIVQQFENHLLVPAIFRRAVGVPPIVVVIALIVGGKLGGLFGLLLAVPLAAVVIEFLNDIAERKHTFFA